MLVEDVMKAPGDHDHTKDVADRGPAAGEIRMAD